MITQLKEVVRRLANDSLEKLRHARYVENLVCYAGLVPDFRDIYNGYEFFCNESRGLYQMPPQFAAALVYLSDKSIADVVEIGTHSGWSTLFLSVYLSRFVSDFRCVSIDPWDKLDPEILPLVQESGLNVEFRRDTSQTYSSDSDLCIIDGCHRYDWLQHDFFNLGVRSRWCWFHDMNDRYCPDVVRFYGEIVGASVEFTQAPNDKPVMGIGIVSMSDYKCNTNLL